MDLRLFGEVFLLDAIARVRRGAGVVWLKQDAS
jgi:hypothetical protein